MRADFQARGTAATPSMRHGIEGVGEETQKLNSAEREGTSLSLRGFEGDPEEFTSQQVLGNNPLPPQLHLPILSPSLYWSKQSFLLVHAIPPDLAGFGLLTQEKDRTTQATL